MTNIQGSALYDATLGDSDMIEEMYQEARRKQSAKVKEVEKEEEEYRPPRRGYTRTVEAIYDLTSNIVALRGELGRWNRTTTANQMPKRPWFPAEVVQARMAAYARSRRDAAIARSQQRHRERKEVVNG